MRLGIVFIFLCALTSGSFVASGYVASAHACRLDGALSHVVLAGPYAPRWLLGTEVESAAFDVGETSGHYQRLTTRLEYFGVRHVDLGVSVPWAYVDAHDAAATAGVGNPVLHARYARSMWTGGFVAAGLQAELPWNGNRAVAQDHGELLPQIGVGHQGELLGAFARVGLRWSMSAHDAHDTATHNAHEHTHDHAHAGTHELGGTSPFVDPHAERELLYRIGWSLHAVRSRWSHAVYADGLRVLHGGLPSDARDQFVLGIQSRYTLSWKTFVHPSFELPLTRPARHDWRLMLEVQRLL